MKIALVLPTFNNEDFTINCLKSIDKNIDINENIDVNVIWVDNNSDINSKQHVLEFLNTCKNIKYDNIFLSKNYGFIKATNIGIEFSLKNKYDYIGIINNDIEVSPHWLKNLIDVLKSDEKIALVGAMEYTANKNVIKEVETLEGSELKDADTSTFENAYNAALQLNLPPKIYDFNNFSNYSFINTYVAYYAVLTKPIIFSKIGLLNENFHMGYGDDTEFNFKITQAGYKIAKARNTVVFHNNQSTFKILYKNDKKISLNQEANRLQLRISKTLNKNKSKKYVIYTAIIDDYDILKTPTAIDIEKFDYICFTNSKTLKIQSIYPWTIIDISDILLGFEVDSRVKYARYFKTHPHLFFENYEKSIWIDANVDIIKDLSDYMYNLKDSYILMADHPFRNDIYEEIKACKTLNKETDEKLNNIYRFLINEQYPYEKTKLVQSGIILREHNNKECIFLMEKWWEMIMNFSKRDQLSFNYVFWKYNGEYASIPWDILSPSIFTTSYRHTNGGKK